MFAIVLLTLAGSPEALTALKDGQAALRTAPAECRQALDENFTVAIRTVDDVPRARLHISGMKLAALLSTCPATVSRSLEAATAALAPKR